MDHTKINSVSKESLLELNRRHEHGSDDANNDSEQVNLLDSGAFRRRDGKTAIVLVYILIAACANMLFGFENTNVSGAKVDFAAEYNISADSTEYGFLVSGLPIGATFGSIFAGPLQDKVGRRITLILDCVAYVGAAFISYSATGFATLATGRLVTGFVIGIFSSTVPMYIAELSPPSIRGQLVTLNQVCICTGVLLGFVSYKVFTPHWRWMFFAGIPVAALLAFMFAFITPFSPRWLMSRGRVAEARVVLMRIRGGDADLVESEIQAMDAALHLSKSTSLVEKLRERHVVWSMTIGIVLAFIQQWSGINAVNGYAQNILSDAGFDAADSATESIYIGVVKTVMVIAALLLMDRLGRRTMLIWGSLGMGVSLVLLSTVLYTNTDPITTVNKYLAAVSLFLFMGFFEMSLGPVLWLLLSELYPLEIRGVAMSAGTTACWLFTFTVTQAYPSMKAAMHVWGSFYFFAGMCFLSVIWIAMYVPETRRKTLEQIEVMLREGKIQ